MTTTRRARSGEPSRRVKTDEERARDDLALAMRKRARAQRKYDAILAQLREAEEELKLAAAVELHAAQHPALPQPEPFPVDDELTTFGADGELSEAAAQ